MNRRSQNRPGGGGVFPDGRGAAILILTLGSLIAGNGCASPKRIHWTTPESVWQAFDQRMQKRDFRGAALCFDDNALAQQQNSDWNAFAPTQRKLVLDKMREERANALQQWQYPPGGYSVQQVRNLGTEAVLNVGNGSSGFQVTVVQTEGQWKILRGVPPRAGF